MPKVQKTIRLSQESLGKLAQIQAHIKALGFDGTETEALAWAINRVYVLEVKRPDPNGERAVMDWIKEISTAPADKKEQNDGRNRI